MIKYLFTGPLAAKCIAALPDGGLPP